LISLYSGNEKNATTKMVIINRNEKTKINERKEGKTNIYRTKMWCLKYINVLNLQKHVEKSSKSG